MFKTIKPERQTFLTENIDKDVVPVESKRGYVFEKVDLIL